MRQILRSPVRLLGIGESSGVGLPEGQVPRLPQRPSPGLRRYEVGEGLVLGEISLADLVPPHGSGVRRRVEGRRVSDRDEEVALRAEQQRLREGARLADMVEVDLVDAGTGVRGFGTCEDQDLVGVLGVRAEAGDVELAVGAEDKTLGAVELAGAVAGRASVVGNE